ncbi:MAG: Eco57I restriction-modification methylase domain-containing protein [Thermoanaerobaculales bacterium]
MAPPDALMELIERFDRGRDTYTSHAYNETQARVEFIDPFFELLGWDIQNKQGHAEAYKDVVHEDAIKVGGSTRAPDYCFRIGGTRKFFVEAKKPAVNVKDDPEPSFQLRRYAWTAKLPLSILTDFDEFAVFDCRVRPDKTDKASAARVRYLTFDQYAERWDEIAEVFSKEAVLRGSFDRFAGGGKGKRGTAEVDAEFLKEIEHWREELARNIALRNRRLSVRELNEAVQRTLDRIIFLRICEDRGIETDRQFQLQFTLNGANTYRRLFDLFQRADERYNSGLFHFQRETGFTEAPDALTPNLSVDDKVLKDIIGNLYYPDSPYEFSVLPPDILGQVYEQFLGKVIRLTAGHHAVVDDKPEVKKAGGVYYTPTYIVDYIVEHTVGELLKGKRPKQAADLRVLDPACGSGSFLLGAYQRLLDWHRDWYVADSPEKHAKARKGGQPELFQAQGGGWRLTTAERKRILLNSIFGVDIDPQAVEVTKLSLLLKVLEGENEQSVNQNLKLLHQRALPDLASNIKCGNSLIGTDYYQGRQGELFDDEEALRVNAFDWDKSFREIFARGNPGFDAVIGNPPYVRIQGFPRDQVAYLTSHYQSATGNCDVYVSFVERGYRLLRERARLGLILPNKFFRTDYGEGLRRLLAADSGVDRIVNFRDSQVFAATTYTCLLFLQKGGNPALQYGTAKATANDLSATTFARVESSGLGPAPWSFEGPGAAMVLTRLVERTRRLLDLPCQMSRGSSTGDDAVFMFEAGTLDIEPGIVRQPVFASDFGRYSFAPARKWKVIFPYVHQEDGGYRLITELELGSQFPKAFEHLRTNQEALKRRKQYKQWFGYSAPRNLGLHDQANLVVPLLADRGLSTLLPKSTRGRLCPMASGGFTLSFPNELEIKPEYVLGLLNSKLLFWRLRTMSNLFRGGWITCTKQYFGELPIRYLSLVSRAERSRHDRMVERVDGMLALHTKLAAARTDHEKTVLQRQIDATDREIDILVYELYGLTDEEIKIVEGQP